MRYFFHVTGSDRVYSDETGEAFADRESATAHAARIARELAEDERMDAISILVTDENGNDIGTVPIASG